MSNAVTVTELALLRTDVEAVALPDTCNLLTVTNVQDGQGGHTSTWGTATAGVACRLDAVSAKEAMTAEAVQAHSRWTLTVPQATTITAAMRVEHGDNTYNIVGLADSGSWEVTKRAILERV